MGLRSGDCAGHDRTWMSLSSNHSVAFRDVIVLLKVLLALHLQFFKAFHHPITQNLTIIVSIHLSLNLYKHPHTMRLFPPPCFTVGSVVQSEMDSPLCFHTYIFPSDPILFILVSSVHKTLFQSSTDQFSCCWANSSRF